MVYALFQGKILSEAEKKNLLSTLLWFQTNCFPLKMKTLSSACSHQHGKSLSLVRCTQIFFAVLFVDFIILFLWHFLILHNFFLTLWWYEINLIEFVSSCFIFGDPRSLRFIPLYHIDVIEQTIKRASQARSWFIFLTDSRSEEICLKLFGKHSE